MTRGGEGLLGRRAEPRLDEPADRGDAQRRGVHHVGVGVGREGRQQVGLLDLGLGPRGDEQRDPQLLQAGHEEGQEAQRGRVGPVGVVDAEHDGLARGQVRAQPVEAVQDSEGRVGRGGGRLAVLQRAREPEHAGGQPRGPLQQVDALGGARLVEQRLEELAHDAEGEVALELCAARAQEARRPVLAWRSGRPRGRPTCRSPPAPRPPRCAPIPRAPRRSPRRCTAAPARARGAGRPREAARRSRRRAYRRDGAAKESNLPAVIARPPRL